MSKDRRRTLELLAPARDCATGIAAIDAGADAVYIGGPSHGARQAASNSVDDIRRLCEYAHKFRARVYVTLNTLIYDDELQGVEGLVGELYAAGTDALIVQDMALMEMNIPPIALHASTQCDSRTPEKADFLEKAGFSQIVLPREFSLEDIRQTAACTTVPLEAFVHGALCVSYSGDCRASLLSGGRSANRGECAQICRLPYDLVDGNGKTIVAGRHLLSLRDLRRIDSLEAMADAGVSSFKIEGRLKGQSYVTNVVRAYSEALDRVCAKRADEYRRLSVGRTDSEFTPALDKAFNRGFTSYFLRETQPPAHSLGSPLTPKFVGERVGCIVSAKGNTLILDNDARLNNGDGIAWFDKRGTFAGTRINRIEGRKITLREPVKIALGTTVYRNYDREYEQKMERGVCRRYIPIQVTLRRAADTVVADIGDPMRGLKISAAIDYHTDEANSPQNDTQREIFSRLGDSIYRLDSFESLVGDKFIARSALTQLRRKALDALDMAAAATHPIDIRRREGAPTPYPTALLNFHDNVANHLADKFYRRHGVTDIQPAMEVAMPQRTDETVVMTSRYCLRRELGACLKTPEGKTLPGTLYLRPAGAASERVRTMRVDCDCANCRMNLTAMPVKK